jgi:hypothetical protein
MTRRNVPVCTIPVLFSLNSSSFRRYVPWLHCKDTIEINIPSKGITRPQSQFPHSCVCERFLYSHDGSAYSAAGKHVDRSWEYINRSQTHGCGNWDWDLAIPVLGIHKWYFVALQCAVCPVMYSYRPHCHRHCVIWQWRGSLKKYSLPPPPASTLCIISWLLYIKSGVGAV